MNNLAMLHKDRLFFQYRSADLVDIISSLTSQLRASSRKISMKYVGPVAIIDPKLFLMCTLDGKLTLSLFEHERLRPTVIMISQGNLTILTQLKQVLHAGIRLAWLYYILLDEGVPVSRDA